MSRTLLILFLLSVNFINEKAKAQATRIYDNRDYGFGELSSTLINNICQDKDGFIWIATEYGLNKFDGIRFVQYLNDIQDSTSISSNNVTVLHRDKKNRLWVGCTNGLQYYDRDKEKFVRVRFPNQVAPHITDVITLHDDSIWVTTSGWGVFLVQPEERVAHSLAYINELSGGMYGRKMLEDRRGQVWLAIDRVGVVLITPGTQKVEKIQIPDMPRPGGGKYNIVETPSGDIILASIAQIMLVNRREGTSRIIPFEHANHAPISEVRIADDGKALLATEGDGIWQIDPTKGLLTVKQAELATRDKDYSRGRIRTFFQDRKKNLWLGWSNQGLVFIPASNKQFEFWRVLSFDEADKRNITSITQDRLKNVWYAVEGKGVFKADSSGNIQKAFPELKDVVKLVAADNGEIWYASHNRGLGIIKPDKNEVIFKNLFVDKEISTMEIGSGNKLYISSFGKGLIVYDINTTQTKTFSTNTRDMSQPSLANDWINVILRDKQGLIWLGHHKGVNCYDPSSERFLPNIPDHVLSEQIALSLLEDSNNNIWVGTYNGLYRVERKSKRVSSFTTRNGLSSNVISGLGQDLQGNIWCSTFKGINYLRSNNHRIISYYTGDGLVDRSYNRSVYFQDDAGKIYFGGKQGITSFYPRQMQIKKYKYPLLITNLYVRNEPVKPGDLSGGKPIYTSNLASTASFRLASNDNNFTIELSTMDFNSPENVHYEYRIKGFNKNWNSTLPGVNLITYNNLSPGNHELEIRACKFGAYSTAKTINLEILPPWHRSTLAYIIYAFMLIGIVILITNYLKERRLERIQAYKLQLFTDISHEIRSPLTLVMSPIDKLIKNATNSENRATLENMHRNAQRILNLVNQLLDVHKLESGQLTLSCQETNIVELIERSALAFENEAIERNINFSTNFDLPYIPLWIDIKSFDTIINNLLSNAFKFTQDGSCIDITVRSPFAADGKKSDNGIEIIVSDSGIGISESDKLHIYKRFYQGNNQVLNSNHGSGIGLHLTKMLVEMHGGKIFAKNNTGGTGSRFVVQIPMGNSHLRKMQIYKPNFSPNPLLAEGNRSEQKEVGLRKPMLHKTNFKVLIVDDDKEILQYVAKELQVNFKVMTAENGRDAFQMALSQNLDLIVSDISMPDIDGFELVKKIKSNSTTNHIPIILLTAKAEQQDRLQGIGLGADAYLTKPFFIEELLILCKNLIKNRMMVKGKYSGAQEQEGKVKTITFKSSDEILMERIVNTVNKYLEDSNLSVQLLAGEVGLSRVQLHRKVKALTGISTSEFIRNLRLKQAEKLLLEKRMNISQVAYALGFTNQTHFSTLFKKLYGLSPSEYIQRHINEEA